MRLHTVLASSVLLSFAFVAVAIGEARADEPGTPSQPPATAAALPSPEGEQPAPKKPEPELKRISLEVNPLGLTIGRYSISGEYLVATHHAVTLNPFYTHAPVTFTVNGKEIDGGALNGFGGELGYRFYTGSKGPNGFFVGPSVLVASFSQSAPAGAEAAGSKGSQSFGSFGGAIDIGGQGVIGPGIVIGGGFGLQYTKNTETLDSANLNLASAIIAGGGLRPRFLFALGYAF
jgi:hypothetical protein